MNMRNIKEADYPNITSRLNEWWGGREMSSLQPRLFFQHFNDTSFIMESDKETAGFIVGFLSQTEPNTAYVHFVGVNLNFRKQGIGKQLYDRFSSSVAAKGVRKIKCITSPVNRNSIAFHSQLGFMIIPGDKEIDGISVHSNYDGKNGDRVVFAKEI
ncbi:GNAT family N-acetyltransferase [Bacillus sp. CECT 9360]|uniref:GNAT family N-acetyltransferase n=1 Tax=Bacillus sp. CECT 9360 TaxID=2845821 RepID=UPI001E3B9C0D|nr:GNAT family N-acetyltransferase [Bacillus sp. CECT 9360]CAH0345645.1 putative protein YqjY [Bacillus sp. CECT 9360]